MAVEAPSPEIIRFAKILIRKALCPSPLIAIKSDPSKRMWDMSADNPVVVPQYGSSSSVWPKAESLPSSMALMKKALMGRQSLQVIGPESMDFDAELEDAELEDEHAARILELSTTCRRASFWRP